MSASALAAPLAPPPVLVSTVRASIIARGDRRLEAENYLSEGYILRQRIEAIPSVPLGRLSRVWQPGRLKGIQVGPDKGLPFLAATQVLDIRPTARKWLSPERTRDSAERYVKRGWILVTCSGSVGDVIVAYSPLDGMLISHDLLRVVPAAPKDCGYLYAYLRTRYARSMMRSTKYGNIIKHLEPEHLQAVPVADVSEATRETLASAISLCFGLRDRAHQLLSAADDIFAKSIGPIDTRAAEVGFPVAGRDLFRKERRLDAYSHNPAAAAAMLALHRNGAPIEPLAKATDRIFGVPRFKHIYTAAGIPYVDSEDLFQVNPELRKFVPKQAKGDAEDYFVEAGWLLMACSGQIYGLNGSVTQATAWHEKKIVSNHVLRIVPRTGVRAGYVRVALGHPTLGRPLVLREVFGTSVPEIDPDSLGDFPIVRLGDIEDSIADMAEQSAALTTLSDKIENASVAYLEAVIAHILGDETEDAIDATLAALRLAEMDVNPQGKLHGLALEKRMKRWQS